MYRQVRKMVGAAIAVGNGNINFQNVKNSAERKRGRVLVPEWKEKDGRYSQKIRYRTEEVWVLTKENNRLVLKPERADFFKWQKERLE